MQRKTKDTMPPEHRRQLEDLGFNWELKVIRKAHDSVPKKWMERYEELKTFYLKSGHCRVPHYLPLSSFVRNNRSRRKRGVEMSEKQIQLLDELHFEWDLSVTPGPPTPPTPPSSSPPRQQQDQSAATSNDNSSANNMAVDSNGDNSNCNNSNSSEQEGKSTNIKQEEVMS